MDEQLTDVLRDFCQAADVIPALQAVQKHIGCLPKEALRAVARKLRVPESTVFGVVSFYSQFHLTPQGKHRICVCAGTACHVRGSAKILRRIESELGVQAGQTTEDLMFTVERVACFGACALAPVVVVDDQVHGSMTPEGTLRRIGKLT